MAPSFASVCGADSTLESRDSSNAVEMLATAHIENPASRRVLEKCGFVHSGTGLEGAPARGGMVPCDRFRLERGAWTSRRAPAIIEAPPSPEQRATP